MATAHTMRAPGPPGPSMYNTPQSTSPMSVQSPHDTHRSMYSYMNYYPNTQQPSNYIHQPGPMQQGAMAPRVQYPMTYQPSQPMPQPTSHPPTPNLNTSPQRSQMLPPQRYGQISMQSPPMAQNLNLQATSPHQSQSPTSPQNAAAPGPIPATTPLVTRKDNEGVQWISFEYSRDRIKVRYEIRCDVESVEVGKLSEEHKSQNCVYPRACKKESYAGNRLQYETECNEVGWALAWLNPLLKGKRGLIQRAVDSWRNSNHDEKVRSRRVRRLAKSQKRNLAQQQIQAGAQTQPTHGQLGSPIKSMMASTSMQSQSPQSMNTSHHHHHLPTEAGLKVEFGDQHARSDSKPQSPEDMRYAQNYQPIYGMSPHGGNMGGTLRDGMGNAGSLPSSVAAVHGLPQPGSIHAGFLSGLPYGTKARKNIMVKDRQRDTPTRIVVRLDGIELDQIPDNHRLKNSVFPRSHYPRQTSGAPQDDASDTEESPVRSRTNVQLELEDGFSAEFPVPKMRSTKRERERDLNDFGCHIMWGTNGRHFDNKNLFLQQAINVFRRDVEDKSSKLGEEVHPRWQIRPGKRKWLDRGDTMMKQDDDK